ncbi:MerR family transcriptional regulator [Alphaproteobacteria bacterium]|nr:MerR family transcriptional regulator [Alphaproteobacteria bacterium]
MFEEDNFYTISKTATIVGVQTHVLRFWEKKFLIITPRKSPSGRRYYSSSDIKYLLMIKKLLYEEGFTIKGAINFINKKYNDKKSTLHDRLNQNIILIKSLINEGSSILKKNLD